MSSKFKGWLQANPLPKDISLALLFVRIVVGIAMVFHGWGKIQNPFGWMPEGSPVPGFFQFLAAISEFGGGIAILLGLLTRLSSLGLAITMLVATGFHAFLLKDPFVATGPGKGSYELALLYFSLCVLFMVMGPGKYSVDAKVFGENNKR